MANWPLQHWPREFPLIYEPRIVCGMCDPDAIPFGRVAEGIGITATAFGLFRHRGFGPKHRWRKGGPVVLNSDVDGWFGRDWRRSEREMLAELQHTHPADFLQSLAQASLEQIGETQRLTQ